MSVLCLCSCIVCFALGGLAVWVGIRQGLKMGKDMDPGVPVAEKVVRMIEPEPEVWNGMDEDEIEIEKIEREAKDKKRGK